MLHSCLKLETVAPKTYRGSWAHSAESKLSHLALLNTTNCDEYRRQSSPCAHHIVIKHATVYKIVRIVYNGKKKVWALLLSQ